MDYTQIHTRKGAKPGPTSIILGGVHGNERCGVTAIEHLLNSLTIDNGTVFLGFGNPHAIDQNVRFTEANLNRMFNRDVIISPADKTTYEFQRAQTLKVYLDQADVLLDIHASTSPAGSSPFLICEKNAWELAPYLPIELVVSGFDAVQPGGTDFYMNQNGSIGICVECGYLKDPESGFRAIQSALAFLKARGHLYNDTVPQPQKHLAIYEQYFTKTDSFVVDHAFRDFDLVQAGDTIGIDGTDPVVATRDSFILFAHGRNKVGSEAFLLGA